MAERLEPAGKDAKRTKQPPFWEEIWGLTEPVKDKHPYHC